MQGKQTTGRNNPWRCYNGLTEANLKLLASSARYSTQDRIANEALAITRYEHPELFNWDRKELETLWRARYGSVGVLSVPLEVCLDLKGTVLKTPAEVERNPLMAFSKEDRFWLSVTVLLFMHGGLTRHSEVISHVDDIQMRFTINEGEK
jgi:hypothetical protein